MQNLRNFAGLWILTSEISDRYLEDRLENNLKNTANYRSVMYRTAYKVQVWDPNQIYWMIPCHQSLDTAKSQVFFDIWSQKQNFIRTRQECRFYENLFCITLILGLEQDVTKKSHNKRESTYIYQKNYEITMNGYQARNINDHHFMTIHSYFITILMITMNNQHSYQHYIHWLIFLKKIIVLG